MNWRAKFSTPTTGSKVRVTNINRLAGNYKIGDIVTLGECYRKKSNGNDLWKTKEHTTFGIFVNNFEVI